MFTGESRHQLDAKNRIRIPAKFKAGLGENFAFVKGHDCISVFPKAAIEKNLKELADSIDPFDATEMKMLREYTRSIVYCEMDNQGRILLEKSLLNHAKLKKDIITTGVVDHLEIVSAESIDNGQASFSDMMKLFSKKRSEKKNEI